MNNNIINIKGTPDGLIFNFDTEQAGFGQICAILEEKLAASGDFYADAEYLIDQPGQFSAEELSIIDDILKKHNIKKGSLRAHQLSTDEFSEVVYQIAEGDSILVTKTVRSGQQVAVRGNAVVMGDINPGGEVKATGNVVVMGRCCGLLHAGAEGEENSYILVYDMQAQQLRIADQVATVPIDAIRSPLKLAVIKDGSIVLTDYIPSKFKQNMEIGEA